MKPGDLLDAEPDLAAQFGVSKPTVRESLQGLAALGMVRVQQGKRTVVLDDPAWDFLAPVIQEAFQLEGRGQELAGQLYEVRLILEAASAEKAAERAGRPEVAQLCGLVEAMRDITDTTRDLDEFLRLDRAFHEMVAKASGNLALRQVIRNIHQFLSSAWTSATITEEELPHLTDLHAAVAGAIASKEARAARQAMEVHLAEAAAKQARRRQQDVREEQRRSGLGHRPGSPPTQDGQRPGSQEDAG
jgi:GntR family transcriptional regulator, transcriptional repressor for pyruvate dehydrogenase complex